MAIITLDKDISEMDDEFKPIAEGTYEATIEKMEVTQSQKGNPMLKCVWGLSDTNQKVFDNIPLNVDFKVKQYCKLIGIESGTEIDTEQFIGAKGIIEVENQTYTDRNGEQKMSSKIKRISAVE